MRSPAAVSVTASRTINPLTPRRCAPRAMRTPISRVRWLTEYAITP
jgi:hypothetical protein